MGQALGGGAGGAEALADVIRQKLQEQAQREQQRQFVAKLTEDQRQANMGNQVAQGNLALGGRRVDEDARQFNEQAPVRLANVGHLNASTDSLNRAPAEAQKGRDFTAAENTATRNFQGGQGDLNRGNAVRIAGINGTNALRVANVRHPDPNTAAAQEKEQNEVADSLALIKQLREDKALPTSTGPIQGRGVGAAYDLEGFTRVKALHDNLVNKLALAQAGKLKGQGPVSNFERDMLAKAATALQMKLGDADYLNELTKVEQQFQRMAGGGAAPAAPGAPAGGGFKVVEIK